MSFHCFSIEFPLVGFNPLQDISPNKEEDKRIIFNNCCFILPSKVIAFSDDFFLFCYQLN